MEAAPSPADQESDYLLWLKEPGEGFVCVFVEDAGKIEEFLHGCGASTTLANATLFLEQTFSVWHHDKRGGPEPRLRCEPCVDDHRANATVVLVREEDFSADMSAEDALAKATRRLGRVHLTIEW